MPDHNKLKPAVMTHTTTTKRVVLTLDEAAIEEALTEWSVRHFPEFRNMKLAFDYDCYGGGSYLCGITVSAERTTEK